MRSRRESLRILVVTNLYPPYSYGGYEDLVDGAVHQWRESGHDVEVLCSDHRTQEMIAPDRGVRRQLPLRWSPTAIPKVSPATKVADAWRSGRAWRRTLDEFDPDVVSLWNMAGLSLGPLDQLEQRRIPVVAVLGNTWTSFAPALDGFLRAFERRPRLGRIARSLTGLPTATPRLGNLTACFATQYLLDEHRRSGTVHATRTEVVPHGVALERFAQLPTRGTEEWNGRALYVGRISREKGLTTTVRAATDLASDGTISKLTIVGGGDSQHAGELRDEIERRGLDGVVDLVGPMAADDVAAAYSDADVLIFPPEWDEPFGIVPLEAMAAGVPVVASGTGGAAEIARDGTNALVFAAGSAESLADAVRRMAADKRLRARLVANGRTTARWLSRTSTYAELLSWHWNAVDHDSTAPPTRAMLPPELIDR